MAQKKHEPDEIVAKLRRRLMNRLPMILGKGFGSGRWNLDVNFCTL